MGINRCKQSLKTWHGLSFYQCSRYIWKDGYCKQHHPDKVKKRKEIKKHINLLKGEVKMDKKKISLGQKIFGMYLGNFGSDQIVEELSGFYPQISKEQIKENLNKVNTSYASLMQAIEDAGGDNKSLKEGIMFNMPAIELLSILFLNDILFSYGKKALGDLLPQELMEENLDKPIVNAINQESFNVKEDNVIKDFIEQEENIIEEISKNLKREKVSKMAFQSVYADKIETKEE